MGYDVTKIFQGAPMVKLGEYIELNLIRNSKGDFGENDAVGVNIEKIMLPMRGNIDSKDFKKFYLIPPNHFAFNPRGSRKLGIGLNKTEQTYIITFNDFVFRIKPNKENKLNSEFLFLFLSRKEWDRYAEYLSWGSSTEVFSWDTLCNVEIPLPAIEVQREYVAAYRSLQQLAEQNEALAAPLQEACFSHLAHIKTTFKSVSLSDYIEQCTDKNSNNEFGVESLQGVTSESVFDTSKAKTEGLKFDTYKIVYENDFAYNPSRINLGSIALRKGNPCIISPMYVVFRLTLKGKLHILPEFLLLWFLRKEFLRSTIFYASGSVRDTFDFYAMQQVKIPLPPIEVQRSIVALYNCAEEARAIAKEAREQLKILAPAMVQRAANTPVEV